MKHRSMYCSNNDKDDCTYFESYYVRLRRNDTKPPAPGLDDVLYLYREWSYGPRSTHERLWPVYGYKDCREKHDPLAPNPRDWSAFCSTDYGYTRIQVPNTTHLYLEQVSDDQYVKVIDSIWVMKEENYFSAWF